MPTAPIENLRLAANGVLVAALFKTSGRETVGFDPKSLNGLGTAPVYSENRPSCYKDADRVAEIPFRHCPLSFMQDIVLDRRSLVPQHVAISLLSVLGVIVFFLHRKMFLLAQGPTQMAAVLAISVIASLAFAWVDYRSFGDIFRRLARISAAGVFAYLLIEPVDFTLAEGGDVRLHALMNACYWPAVSFALMGMFRPSMAYAPAMYLLLSREAAIDISGYALSTLDIRYMMEMAMFLGISASVLGLLALPRSPIRLGGEQRRLLEHCLAFSAIGMHLANYLWSGYAKFALGPTPWTWIVENPTANAILISLHKGMSPLGQWPAITQAAYDWLSFGAPMNNFAVATIQAAACIVIFRLPLLRVATLFYDLLHIGIYVFGGLFFWPWIWNNASVLVALKGKSDNDISLAPRLCCLAVMALGFSYKLGDAAFLAWFDVAEIRSPVIQVHNTENDRWVDVPVSFFLSHAYAMSHGYYGEGIREGHYAPMQNHLSRTLDLMRRSGECASPSALSRPETPAEYDRRIATLEAFLRAHHEKMLSRADETGRVSFYLRGHHHPSNPLLNREFANVDLREVDAYRYLDRSVCLSMSDGGLRENYVKRDAHVVPVGRISP